MRFFNHRRQHGSINQLNILSFGKSLRFRSKNTRSNHKSARGSFRNHHTQQLTHDIDRHLIGSPLLTLNKKYLAFFFQHQINSTIRSAIIIFNNRKAPHPENLAYK